ncbi:MAG: ATP-binding protein, partial [Bacillota bacterium]
MTRVKPRDREQTKNNLLQNEDLLKKHVSRLAGYREKVNNYQEQQDEQELKYRQLELEAGEINFYWQDNLEEITEIRTDKIEKGKLISQIQEVQDLNQQLERIIEKKKQLLEEKNVLQTHLQQEKEGQPEQVLKKTFLLGTAGILLGAAGSWILLPVGLIIGFGSLIFTLIYYLSFYQEELQLARDRQQLKEDLEIVTGKIEEKDKEIKNLKNKLRPAEQVLDHYRDLLGLPQDESQAGELIKDYFVSIKQLQQRYHEWQLGQKKLNQKKEKLQEELATLLVYLTRLEDNFCDDRFALPPETDIIDYSADLFSALDKAAEYLELARELEEKEYQKKNIEQEVKDFFAELDFSVNDDITQTLYRYLNNAELAAEYKGLKEDYKAIYRQLVETLSSADRIKTAFLAYDNYGKEFNLQASVEEEKLLRNFAELCQQFTSREEITTRHQQVTAELKEFKQNRDSLKDQLTSLNKKKEELSSPQKIEDAHQEKNQARSELRTLAERYAVRKSVSFILNKVRERAISRARKDLLQPAGQLLQEMTAGEYQKIEPPENMGATNFKTILRKNKQQKDVGSLSRGTREQLFLAIRISRIREIEPALPVVLDDSLVNFDHLHLQQASEILSRLGESHQIFVLTCHPHLVDYISSSSSGAQYWQLEQGNFSQTSAEKLSAYLSGTGQKK